MAREKPNLIWLYILIKCVLYKLINPNKLLLQKCNKFYLLKFIPFF